MQICQRQQFQVAARPRPTCPAASAVGKVGQARMTESYSLWLKPSGHVADKLAQEIRSQASEHLAPVFEPHVTLLGGIEGDKEHIYQATQELAKQIEVPV